jgi:flagellar hook-associated protein 3 FlgL
VVMRVTQNAVTSMMLAGLQNNQARMSTLEQQLSSGQQITKPSDDPVGTDQAMRFRSDISRNTQYQRNAQDGLSWLGTADNALQSGVSILQRLQTLTTQAANTGSGDSTSRAAIATEVSALKQEMLGVANTTYLGRPIFGGTTSNSAAYAQDASGVVSYQGDSGTVMRTVADNTQVQVNISNTAAFGASGSDVFSMFDQISNDLTNNPGNLTNDLTSISTALGNMTSAQATEGAAYNRITALNNSSTNLVTNLTSNLSSVEDVDTAKTITDFTMQQASYQASLSAMSQVLQLSLTSFLK